MPELRREEIEERLAEMANMDILGCSKVFNMW